MGILYRIFRYLNGCMTRSEMATLKKQEEDRITRELNEIIYTTKPYMTRADAKRGFYLNTCDEVFPSIYIGDSYCAKNKTFLKQIGVTHVLNTAEGKLLGMVDTDSDYYKYCGIKYMGLHLMDLPVTDISSHFYEAANFIHDAISSGGKVLVHCLMGLSRSSTCVLAYLMIREGMTAADAMRQVRRHREIRPNDGFLQQLAELDIKLKRTRVSRRYGHIEVEKPKPRLDDKSSLWLPTGRFLSFRPSLNVYKIHNHNY